MSTDFSQDRSAALHCRVPFFKHEQGRTLAKTLRQSGLKIQAQIQGDQLRVTAKSRDELQKAIRLLKEHDQGLPLQFINYR